MTRRKQEKQKLNGDSSASSRQTPGSRRPGRFEESADLIYAETAYLYDHLPRYANRIDRDFYLAEARACGGPVLELGCGTGRILLPIARAGVPVTGIDLTREMLDILKQKLANEPPQVRQRVTLLLGDMQTFNLDRRFPLITTPFRSFQHLLRLEDQLACLERVRRHLAPGGRFILDLFHPDREAWCGPDTDAEIEDVPPVTLPDGNTLSRTTRVAAVDRPRQILDLEMRYYLTDRSGRTRTYLQAFKWRCFFRYEVEHLLARCGFRIVALYGNYDRSPLSNDSPELIFIAEKQ